MRNPTEKEKVGVGKKNEEEKKKTVEGGGGMKESC